MIKLCMFDLDGTLLDTLSTIAHYGNLALNTHGVSTIDKENYKYLVGNGAKILVKRMLEFSNSYSDELYNKVYDTYMKAYDSNPTYLTEPFDDICNMLSSLKKSGIESAVISNKPDFASKSVCKAKIPTGLLSEVRGQQEGVKIKPDPEGAFLIMKKFNVVESEVIFIGDTGVDMETGKNIGAYTVGVTWGFRKKDELVSSGADCIIDNPLELIEIVSRFNNK